MRSRDEECEITHRTQRVDRGGDGVQVRHVLSLTQNHSQELPDLTRPEYASNWERVISGVRTAFDVAIADEPLE